VAEVRKQRQVFQLSRADGRFELALDTVAGIGAFLEIELLAAADELAAAQAAVVALGEELGAGAITSRSYLAMVLERSGQTEATGE
jgi:adenylate cyclase class IV